MRVLITGGAGFIGSLPVSGLLWIFITILAALMLKYTTFGRGLYAVGGNEEASRLSGIRVKRNVIYVFVLSGVPMLTEAPAAGNAGSVSNSLVTMAALASSSSRTVHLLESSIPAAEQLEMMVAPVTVTV